MNNNKFIVDIIDKYISIMFIEVAKKYNLTTGDFAPDQENMLDMTKDRLYNLLFAYKKQNKKG